MGDARFGRLRLHAHRVARHPEARTSHHGHGNQRPNRYQTLIPWLLHNFPDDRQQGYALADYIFLQRHLKRIGILQVNNRYGRIGKEIFVQTARRMGYQPVVEVWYAAGAKDFASQLKTINASKVDGLVIWAMRTRQDSSSKQMRATGMKQFGVWQQPHLLPRSR